jgi:uncharacterized Fe-S cluster-containing MiaB family protein
MSRYDRFEKELEQLINKFSLENDSNTPDFILAQYLIECLHSFNKSIEIRTGWYSDKHSSKQNKTGD